MLSSRHSRWLIALYNILEMMQKPLFEFNNFVFYTRCDYDGRPKHIQHIYNPCYDNNNACKVSTSYPAFSAQVLNSGISSCLDVR